MMLGLNKKEICLVLSLWLFVTLLTAIPYYLAYQNPPPGKIFTGNFAPVGDFNAHYSFIQQAARGSWLFKNLNTPEPHAPFYFHLEYLIIGKTCYFTGMSVEAAFHLWRILGGLALLWAFTLLAKTFYPSFSHLAWLLAFFSLGSGFGWLTILFKGLQTWSFPLDMISETHPFNQLFFTPHSTWAMALSIFGFYWLFQGEETQKRGAFIISGALFFLTGLFRPFSLIIYGVLIAVWILAKFFRRALSWPQFLNYILALILPTLALAYNVYVFRIHPIFRWWGLQNYAPPPALGELSLSLGLPFFAALIALLNTDFLKTPPRFQLLSLWAGLTLSLIYCSDAFTFSYQFVTLLMPPLYLIAAGLIFPLENVTTWRQPLNSTIKSPFLKTALLSLLLILTSLTNVATLLKINQTTQNGAAYIDKDFLTAMRWVEKNTNASARFFASFYTGSFLARYTGRVVFAGYNYSTVDFENKLKMIEQFYEGNGDKRRFLNQWHLDYVWSGPQEGALFNLDNQPYLHQVYHNPTITIYQVQP